MMTMAKKNKNRNENNVIELFEDYCFQCSCGSFSFYLFVDLRDHRYISRIKCTECGGYLFIAKESAE